MKPTSKGSVQPRMLRDKAEELLRKSSAEVASMSAADIQTLVHELQIHQIELEMQNDELRRTQLELAASRDRYSELYDFSPAGYLTLDSRGVIQEANLAAATLLRVDRSRLIGTPLPRLVVPRDTDTLHQCLGEIFARDSKQSCRLQLASTGTDECFFELEGIAVANERDRGRQCRASLIDVTARLRAENVLRSAHDELELRVDQRTSELGAANRKLQHAIEVREQAEQAARESATRLRLIADSLPVAIAYVDDQQRYQFNNAVYSKWFGIPVDSIKGMHISQLVGETAYRPIVGKIEAALAGQETSFENELLDADGEPRVVRGTFMPDRTSSGNVQGFFVLVDDITQRRKAERQLLQSERLAAIGEAMAGLSHESRNALQRSQDCLELLALRVKDRSELKNLIDRIQNAQDHLHHVFEDVRTYAAPIQLERKPQDLRAILRDTWGHLAPLREGRDVRLDETGMQLDLQCEVERLAVVQVFRNILENSLAAVNEPGRIEVVWSEDELAGAPAVRIAMRNNGPPLTAEERQNIFQPFYTTKMHGTGLGMAITRRIVEAHDGTIDVGENGPGAEIVIRLPRAAGRQT